MVQSTKRINNIYQTIDSLSHMMTGLKVEGFQLENLKRGMHYGYNLAYGVVDDKIKVGFRIFYQKDNDPNAVSSIEQTIKDNVEFVRTIDMKFSPKGSSLKSFIFEEPIQYHFEYEVGGKIIDFRVLHIDPKKVPKFWGNFPPASIPELVVNVKKSIGTYVNKVKIILRNKNFVFERYEMQKYGYWVDKSYTEYIYFVQISGKAYGKDCSFIIKNFETENIKKRLKIELKKVRRDKSSK